MSEMAQLIGPDALRIERLLPGPIERVWEYLTVSDKRAKWLAGGAIDLRHDGQVEHVFRNADLSTADDQPAAKFAAHAGEMRLVGRIIKCEPPRLLSYLWGESDDSPEVTFELTPQDGKVLLQLTQRRTADRALRIDMSAGWHTHLAILSARLSDETPPSFWSTFARLEAEYQKLIPQD